MALSGIALDTPPASALDLTRVFTFPDMLPIHEPAVIFQKLDDGAVLFAPATEVYFGLNEVGTRIWQLLPPASRTLDELCAVLGAEYPDAPAAVIRDDVQELLAQLATEGLVRAPDPSGVDAEPAA